LGYNGGSPNACVAQNGAKESPKEPKRESGEAQEMHMGAQKNPKGCPGEPNGNPGEAKLFQRRPRGAHESLKESEGNRKEFNGARPPVQKKHTVAGRPKAPG